VLDLPRVVEAQPVGEDDLLESFVEEAVFVAFIPRLRELQFVANAESRDRSPSGCVGR
jgi:hypothetical protein